MNILITGDTYEGHSSQTHTILDHFVDELVEQIKQNDCRALIHVGDWISSDQRQFETVLKRFRNKVSIPILTAKGNHDCLDTQTEVYTNNGWKFYNQLVASDLVLGIDTETEEVKFQAINNIIIKQQSGPIKSFSGKRIDLLCTDQHRILYKKRKNKKSGTSKLSYSPQKYLTTGRIYIPVAGNHNSSKCSYTDDEIYLSALLLTDGHIIKYKGKISSFVLYQSENNIETFRIALKNVGLSFREKYRDRKITQICGRKLLGKPQRSYELYVNSEQSKKFLYKMKITDRSKVPCWATLLNDHQFNIFLNGLIEGDGTFCKNGGFALYKKKEFLDEIQALCAMHGYSASFYKYRETQYKLNIAKRESISLDLSIHKFVDIQYDDLVWCLSVPSGNFLIRRNGKSHFTGNCWHPQKDRKRKTIPQLFEYHKKLFELFNVHHLQHNPITIEDVLFCGFDGWYNVANPPSNDSFWMPLSTEGASTHAYMQHTANRALNQIIQVDTSKCRKSVCVTHFTPPLGEDDDWYDMSASPSALEFVTEKFDYFLVGHSHKRVDKTIGKCRVINPGSDYNQPRFVLLEV